MTDPTQQPYPQQPYPQQPYGQPAGPVRPAFAPDGTPASDKLILPAFLLAFFLGSLGVHRFYVGKIGTGILMIVTLGGLGLWTLIDVIVIAVGAFKDAEGRKLISWT